MSEVFLTLFNRSLTACWLIAVVLVLRLVFRKAPRWPRLLLWAVVGFRLLPFSIPHPWSLVPTREVLPEEMLYSSTPHIESGIPAVDAAVNPAFTGSLAPSPGASVNPLQVLTWLAGWVWLIGLAGMLLYAAISWLRLKGRLRTAVRLQDNIWQSDRIAAPFVLGMLRPRIYLPFSLPQAALPSVIAHEQAHIARKDHWFKLLGFAFLAVYWFNPVIWLAYILFCRDMEAACDERVVSKLDPAGRADYSQALLACSLPRRRVAPCPLAFGEVGVKSRVKAVLRYKKPAVILLVLLICSVTAALTFFAYDQPDESLQWAKKLQAEDITRLELVVMPQDTDKQYKLLNEEETGRAVELINQSRGRRLSRHEALAGGCITFYVTTADGVTHTIANEGNTYLTIDGAYFDAGYDWLAGWESDWGEGNAALPEGFFENKALALEDLPQPSAALNTAIQAAVLGQDGAPVQALVTRVESHAVLDMTRQDGQTLVYALVREETFDLTGSEPVAVSGSVLPTALTFSGDETAGYTLLDYWIAQDGSLYTASIRETFTPLAAQRLFAGDTVYSRKLRTINLQKAQIAWEQAHAEESDGSGFLSSSEIGAVLEARLVNAGVLEPGQIGRELVWRETELRTEVIAGQECLVLPLYYADTAENGELAGQWYGDFALSGNRNNIYRYDPAGTSEDTMWLEFVPAVFGPQATPAPDTGAAQGAAVQAAFADEALLANLTDYDQFADYPSDYQTQLVFTADAPVSDFRFLALTLRDVGADGTMYYDTEDLYTTDALTEGKPVVIRMTFAGDVPDRGIAYTDADGITRYFAITTSGEDGSLLLMEFTV